MAHIGVSRRLVTLGIGSVLLLVLGALLGTLLSGVAGAGPEGKTKVVRVCVNQADGGVRVITGNTACAAGEVVKRLAVGPRVNADILDGLALLPLP